jgi:hypothetical protein
MLGGAHCTPDVTDDIVGLVPVRYADQSTLASGFDYLWVFRVLAPGLL